MNNDLKRAQLTAARRLLATLGYSIFTAAKRYCRDEYSFVAVDMNASVRQMHLLCLRKDGLEIRSYTDKLLNQSILARLRAELSLPLRVGRILPHNASLNVIRFIASTQHEECKTLLNGGRL